MQNEKKYEITQAQVNAIANLLADLQYRQVFKCFEVLNSLKLIEDTKIEAAENEPQVA